MARAVNPRPDVNQALLRGDSPSANVPSGGWAAVGLGANLGDPVATLSAAVAALGCVPCSAVQAVSSVWRSAPVEAEGPDFYNAVALVKTDLAPEEFLRQLQGIEVQHGRQRPFRNAPRTLDLDLLFLGSQEWMSQTLVLPHPRLHQRAFVLRPLLELLPDCELPKLGCLSRYLPDVADQRIERLAELGGSSIGPAAS